LPDAVETGVVEDLHLLALDRIIAGTTEAADDAAAIAAALEALTSLPAVDAAGYLEVDRPAGTATLRQSHELPEDTGGRLSALDISTPPLHNTFIHRQPVFLRDLAADATCGQMMAPFASLAMVPVVTRDDVTGALLAVRRRPQEWSREEQLVMPSAGRELGGALERLSAERAVGDRRLPLYDLLDAMGELLFVTTGDGRLMWANKAAERHLGFDDRDMAHMTFLDVFPHGSRMEAAAMVAELLEGGDQALAVPLMARDGSSVDVETHVRWGSWDGRRVLFFSGRQRNGHSDEAAGPDVLQGLLDIIMTLAREHDPITAVHSRRVARMATLIARRLGMSEQQVAGLRLAGELHDIGKFSIPAEVLLRPGHLEREEIDLIHSHPSTGFDLVRVTSSPWPLAETILQHHERLDGSGYPRGLQGGGILKEARILAVADVFEAMSARRPYRVAHSIDETLEELHEGSGRCYDADAVAACELVCRDGRYSDIVPFDSAGYG